MRVSEDYGRACNCPVLQEELAKREVRAARFQVECQGVTYRPLIDEDEEKKRERAARFGTQYSAVDHSGQQSEGPSWVLVLVVGNCSWQRDCRVAKDGKT